MEKPKILFVIPWLPYPLKSGGHQAIFNGIYAIKDDFDIYISFPFINEEKYKEESNAFLKIVPNVHLLPLKKRESKQNSEYPLWYRIASIIKNSIQVIIEKNGLGDEQNDEYVMCTKWIKSITPLSELWLNHVTKICQDHQFDIIQVEMPWFVSQILSLPKGPKKVFVHHELGLVRRGLEQNNYPNNEYVKACKSFADMAEIGLLNMYDAVITLSSIDKQKMIEHGVSVPVYDSFAIVNQSKEIFFEKTDGMHLSFVGPDTHSPNFVGITWFLENCWFALREININYRLSIIGNWSQEHITEYTAKYPNVEFLGFVDNLGDSIRGTIMIVPITIGSGIRMKILEACSIGVPFVSTSVGAEGIPVEDGKDCFIADNPKSFVEKLYKLRDVALQKRFVENAHNMILDNYSIEALRKNRLEIYSRI